MCRTREYFALHRLQLFNSVLIFRSRIREAWKGHSRPIHKREKIVVTARYSVYKDGTHQTVFLTSDRLNLHPFSFIMHGQCTPSRESSERNEYTGSPSVTL